MRDYVTPGGESIFIQGDALEDAEITARKQTPPLPRHDATPLRKTPCFRKRCREGN